MAKKHRTVVPDFASHKPHPQRPSAPAAKVQPGPGPVQRVKPHATSAKSGRRGQ